MPFYLEEKDILGELTDCKSVLIVPCRFCPAASAAIKYEKPYFEFFRRFLKTGAYEEQITSLRTRLAEQGIKSGVFRSRSIQQFVLCMWTDARRRKLQKTMLKYDAIVVLGCEAAVETVYEAVKSSGCKVIQGMKTEGIMNVVPRYQMPGKLWIKCVGVTKVLH